MKKALILIAIVASTFGASMFHPAPAHAAIVTQPGIILSSKVTSDPPPTYDFGRLIGGPCCPASPGVVCQTITDTRTENYGFFSTTDYQAHLQVCRQWNVLLYGGVVWDVTWRMWVDHLKPTIGWGGGVLSAGHYEYECYATFTGSNGILCGTHYGFHVDAGTAVQQCFGYCIQTESIIAYMDVYLDGSWDGDINTN